MKPIRLIPPLLACLLSLSPAQKRAAAPAAAPPAAAPAASPEKLERAIESLNFRIDELEKRIDDILWFDRVSDVARIDKIFIAGPPPARVPNPTAMGARNPVKFWCYVFLPRGIDRSGKYPLILLPHGGVHGNFTTYHAHIIREMVAQGYVVAAPEYRGSSGYGRSFSEQIDYGGLEIEDNHAARDHMIAEYAFIDSTRVGIAGWSHGGLIALMDIFAHPKDYAAAFAGVPVSDLVQRMGYYDEEYRAEFSAPYHLGKTAHDDAAEYRKRSPVNHVRDLDTPLLIHTNTNDDDVNVLEVEHLIEALKAAGKKFEYEIFEDVPGGHSFDRIDTRRAKEIRLKIYAFLAKYLSPPHPFGAIGDLKNAGYR